ncbi:hypothetical protein Cantr_05725 [Candida viswanathii]|uniref:Tubulin-folding cofactor C n=1 Tax=Candida viswanathii TaxID=5486 RepID=A0A367XQV5_9ASCO|nr:hypothetical protein Cantr_05725 [Candida viswanathii]
MEGSNIRPQRGRCILILECHQARLHNVHNSIVLVQSVENDRIIIENCSQLRVNNGIEVDDFDFPTKETENPHFQRIDTARDAEILNGINAGGDVATVDLLLRTCIGAP